MIISMMMKQMQYSERITYNVNYICKKCGEKCHSTYTKDVPKL